MGTLTEVWVVANSTTGDIYGLFSTRGEANYQWPTTRNTSRTRYPVFSTREEFEVHVKGESVSQKQTVFIVSSPGNGSRSIKAVFTEEHAAEKLCAQNPGFEQSLWSLYIPDPVGIPRLVQIVENTETQEVCAVFSQPKQASDYCRGKLYLGWRDHLVYLTYEAYVGVAKSIPQPEAPPERRRETVVSAVSVVSVVSVFIVSEKQGSSKTVKGVFSDNALAYSVVQRLPHHTMSEWTIWSSSLKPDGVWVVSNPNDGEVLQVFPDLAQARHYCGTNENLTYQYNTVFSDLHRYEDHMSHLRGWVPPGPASEESPEKTIYAVVTLESQASDSTGAVLCKLFDSRELADEYCRNRDDVAIESWAVYGSGEPPVMVRADSRVDVSMSVDEHPDIAEQLWGKPVDPLPKDPSLVYPMVPPTRTNNIDPDKCNEQKMPLASEDAPAQTLPPIPPPPPYWTPPTEAALLEERKHLPPADLLVMFGAVEAQPVGSVTQAFVSLAHEVAGDPPHEGTGEALHQLLISWNALPPHRFWDLVTTHEHEVMVKLLDRCGNLVRDSGLVIKGHAMDCITHGGRTYNLTTEVAEDGSSVYKEVEVFAF